MRKEQRIVPLSVPRFTIPFFARNSVIWGVLVWKIYSCAPFEKTRQKMERNKRGNMFFEDENGQVWRFENFEIYLNMTYIETHSNYETLLKKY